MSLIENATLNFTNVKFQNLQTILIQANAINRLSILSCRFINVSNSFSTPLIQISGAGVVYYIGGHLIKDTNFENCTVRNSLILVEKGTIRLILNNATFLNIRQSFTNSPTLEDLEYHTELIGGVCLLAWKNVGITIINSVFHRIYGVNCISLKSSAIAITSSSFNNDGLKLTEEPKIMSWLHMNGGTTDVAPYGTVRLLNTTFASNSFFGESGGVSLFDIWFVEILGTSIYWEF